MQRLTSATHNTNSANTLTDPPKKPKSRQHSIESSRIKLSVSGAFKRGARGPHSSSKLQQHHQIAATILQRRERLRVYENNKDVTPRNLVHPIYSVLDERRTAFDAIGQLGSSHGGSVSYSVSQLGASSQQNQRASLATVSSYSSIYTLDVVLAAKSGREDSLISSVKGSVRGYDNIAEEVEDAISQFHLPRLESQERFQLTDRVTITLRETETFFMFELPQLTELANSKKGKIVEEENERYSHIRGGHGRKTMEGESQTSQVYTKTRGTYIGREERKNRSTFVNNWVMYDTYNEGEIGSGEPYENSRFKFPASRTSALITRDAETEQLQTIASKDEYEDATRIVLRILASKNFEEAQRRFAGMLTQDPCDTDLKLIYGLELLWRHACPSEHKRPATTFRWNPVNYSLLAVGYGAVTKTNVTDEPTGLVLIWCAKNPSIPDRYYEFNSEISDLDWSKSRPNLLAIGFYDGVVRVIDISKSKLTIIRQSQRKTSPSYGPHWQVQWWSIGSESFQSSEFNEHLYTSNQDGRICYYETDEDFASRELVQLQRIEGKIPGIPRVNHCLGHPVPISRTPGILQLRRHPTKEGVYLVGTEEGCVHRCSTNHPNSYLECFLAHDGPIYCLDYSPFCNKLILTCGADWTARIWAEGLPEPLLTYGTRMASVNTAAWSPRNSTIFASAVGNEICLWDLRRKTHRPASITKITSHNARIQKIEFTRSGEQLVAIDDEGIVYVHGLVGMPLPAYDQTKALIDAVEKALLTKPELLRKLKKLGPPFSDDEET